jgi:8-oxo-dGTP diphosphatase
VEPGTPLECVALLLVRDRQVLAERRKLTKRLATGAVAIPGGHVEPGERPAEALMREAREELGIVPHETAFVCTLMHLAEELRTLHYYAVRSWTGDIVPEEAETVVWLALEAVQQLDFDVDRTAVTEYQRLTREGGLLWRTNR